MAIYHVYIGEKEYVVEIDNNEMKINGEPTEAMLEILNDQGLYMLDINGLKQDVLISKEKNGRLQLTTQGNQREATITNDRKGYPRNKQTLNLGDIIAPMPGCVIDIHVSEKDSIEKGQVLITLESMKMQMEFKAPFKGFVHRIFVHSNEKIEKDAIMIQVRSDTV
jgi:biotin carboxyl carrier protein